MGAARERDAGDLGEFLARAVPVDADGAGGNVTLPLADYLRLVESVEAARRAPQEVMFQDVLVEGFRRLFQAPA